MSHPVVAVSVCHKDHLALYWWSLWLHALGGLNDTKLYITVTDKAGKLNTVKQALDVLRVTFREVVTTDFIDDDFGYPWGANLMFEVTMRRASSDGQPIIWMEPDLIPTAPDWFEKIVADYEHHETPFCGPIYPDHMNGTGIYPHDWERYMSETPLCNCPKKVPFDVYIGQSVVGHATNSPLWFHDKTRAASIVGIGHDVVLWHPSKDGSLIRRLNENLRIASPELFRFEPRYIMFRKSNAAFNQSLAGLTGVDAIVHLGRSSAVRITDAALYSKLLDMSDNLSIEEITANDFALYSKQTDM